jgi:hypothetical protein
MRMLQQGRIPSPSCHIPSPLLPTNAGTKAAQVCSFDSPLDGPLDALQRLRELAHNSKQVRRIELPEIGAEEEATPGCSPS